MVVNYYIISWRYIAMTQKYRAVGNSLQGVTAVPLMIEKFTIVCHSLPRHTNISEIYFNLPHQYFKAFNSPDVCNCLLDFVYTLIGYRMNR